MFIGILYYQNRALCQTNCYLTKKIFYFLYIRVWDVPSHFVKGDILKIIFEASIDWGALELALPWVGTHERLCVSPGTWTQGSFFLSHSRCEWCHVKQTLTVIRFAENNYRVKLKTWNMLREGYTFGREWISFVSFFFKWN